MVYGALTPPLANSPTATAWVWFERTQAGIASRNRVFVEGWLLIYNLYKQLVHQPLARVRKGLQPGHLAVLCSQLNN